MSQATVETHFTRVPMTLDLRDRDRDRYRGQAAVLGYEDGAGTPGQLPRA